MLSQSKILVSITVVSLLALSLLFVHPKNPAKAGDPFLSPGSPPLSVTNSQAASGRPKLRAPNSPPTADSVEIRQQTYVQSRIVELDELGRNEDRASLDAILGELTNLDPEIREAARNAVIQFGSRDAIPKLEDAIGQTDDPHEKAALADAIEFLKLPTITELHLVPKKTTSPAITDH